MGKPKHSHDRRGEQKGAQNYDEGQYGPKALSAKWREITDHSGRESGGQRNVDSAAEHERKIANPEFQADGRHRLFENRSQHDEAERGSERTRRDLDLERHDHAPERFQGHANERGEATIKQSRKGGGDH